jgi:UPF0755 protein
MKKVLIAGLGLVAVAALAGFGSWFWLEGQLNASGTGTAQTFEVPKGASGRALGASLSQAGVVASPVVWRYLLWKRGGLKAKAGKHELAAGFSVEQVAEALEASPKVEEEPFTVVEGWRLKETDEALVQKGWAKPGEYTKAALDAARFKAPFPPPARGLEGFLYPETYSFPVGGFTIDALIQRQLDLFVERFYIPNQAAIASSGRSLEQLVVMASVLEREEPTPSQRATVAGVLWKRFDKSTPLGADATSRYELPEWNDRKAFLVKLRDPKDPYNTRLRPGLPPTALGATTSDSLNAALKPEVNPYWYYLHDSQKRLHPSKNAEEHEALRAKYGVY